MKIPEHGGNINLEEIYLDFSANINPLGMPLGVKQAVIRDSENWEKYPDPYCRKLREKLAEKENIPAENIVCGNGAADLIYRITAALKPKKAVILSPTFSEYKKALQQIGSNIIEYQLYEEDSFDIRSDFLDYIAEDVDMVILCSPNNPTGRMIRPELLKKIAGKCRQFNINLLIDECFIELTDCTYEYYAESYLFPEMIILKAFTKTYAMAGLRLGYAIFGRTSTAHDVQERDQFWSVSTAAQTAGTAALEEIEYIKKAVELISHEREKLTEKLKESGFLVCPSRANYILFKSEVPLYEKLLGYGILVRNCANYSGLSEMWHRTAVRTAHENEILIETLNKIMR